MPVDRSPAAARPDGLRPGCYVVTYTVIYAPLGRPEPQTFLGTLRVSDQDDELRFSGDLYRAGTFAPIDPTGPNAEVFVAMPDPRDGIPTQPINGYDSYLRGLDLRPAPDGGLAIHFERYGYAAPSSTDRPDWSYGGSFEANLEPGRADRTAPTAGDSWVGAVRDAAGELVGLLTLAWASPLLRKATILIAHEDGAETPMDNGQGVAWADVFRRIGWDLRVEEAQIQPTPPASGVWEKTDLHGGMIETRSIADLDAQWLYHLLCVKTFGTSVESGGFMYDRANLDENNIPREGAAVSSEALFGTDPKFGAAAGLRAADVPGAYFRRAVHEIGHAMGLYHDTTGPYIMAPTDAVARFGTDASPFPDNIVYEHSAIDRHRLRHLPDVHVRPGGPFAPERMNSNYLGLPPLPVPYRIDSR